MDVSEFNTLATERIAHHGLSLPFAVEDVLDPPSSLAVTNFSPWGDHKPYGIIFSRMYVKHMLPEEARDVIDHEVAHALLPFEHDHDDVWAAKAFEISGSKRASVPFYELTNKPSETAMNRYVADVILYRLGSMSSPIPPRSMYPFGVPMQDGSFYNPWDDPKGADRMAAWYDAVTNR